jgi:hypothetical protein
MEVGGGSWDQSVAPGTGAEPAAFSYRAADRLSTANRKHPDAVSPQSAIRNQLP